MPYLGEIKDPDAVGVISDEGYSEYEAVAEALIEYTDANKKVYCLYNSFARRVADSLNLSVTCFTNNQKLGRRGLSHIWPSFIFGLHLSGVLILCREGAVSTELLNLIRICKSVGIFVILRG